MQTQDIQDIRGRIERFGKPRKTNQPNVVTLGDCRQTQAVIRRPTVLLITFASQMIHQLAISSYVCKHPTSFRLIDDRMLSYLVKLIRAQGGCLGTKSR